jgi:hypothetical protein
VRRSLPPTTDREHRSDVIPPDTAKVAENHYARPYHSSRQCRGRSAHQSSRRRP